MSTSDTPRCDEKMCRFSSLFASEDAYWVPASFARQLERELTEAHALLARARDELSDLNQQENDEGTLIGDIDATLRSS